jgi:hypothetical protein
MGGDRLALFQHPVFEGELFADDLNGWSRTSPGF